MDESMMVNRKMLYTLFSDLSGYPNPDDPGDPNNPFGPYGPGGPVSRLSVRKVFAAALTSHVIQSVVAQQQMVMALSDGDAQGRLFGSVQSTIDQFVDEFCGTKWPHWPWPRPWPWPWQLHIPIWWPDPPPDEPRPIDLVMAGMQFYNAARVLDKGELSEMFNRAADKLVETGLAVG